MKKIPFDRSKRISDEIQKIVASFFYKDHFDDRIKGVNITGIKVTKDLKLAYVYYFITGDELQRQMCEEALYDLKREIKRDISMNLSLKYTPEIKFFFDQSIERGERIDDLLNEIKSQHK